VFGSGEGEWCPELVHFYLSLAAVLAQGSGENSTLNNNMISTVAISHPSLETQLFYRSFPSSAAFFPSRCLHGLQDPTESSVLDGL